MISPIAAGVEAPRRSIIARSYVVAFTALAMLGGMSLYELHPSIRPERA